MSKSGWFSRFTRPGKDGDETRPAAPQPAAGASTQAAAAATAAAPAAAAPTSVAPALEAGSYEQLLAEGVCALDAGRPDEAIGALGRAAHLRPDLAEVHARLASAFQKTGRNEAARLACLRALELDPENAAARSVLAGLPPPPPQRNDFEVGQVLRGETTSLCFEVLNVRKGGFGAVYIVRQQESLWVLKTFQARYLWSDEDRQRFEREAVTWVMLDRHPNVVYAFGVERIQGSPCLELEYVKGGDLAALLEAGPLPVARAVELALQFCDGMAYAHGKLGLVHRDVKPSNCLLAEDGTLKVTDFGLARAFGEAQEYGLGLVNLGGELKAQYTQTAGTQQYMAPEQFRAGAVLDTRTDIHAFGVMFYEMLTGDLPLIGSIAHVHIAENAPSYRLPAALLQLILRCTEREPEARPASFADARDRLAAAYVELTGQPAPRASEPLAMTMAAWKNKAVALWNLGRAAETLECCERGLKLDPQDALLWHVKGMAAGALGRFQEQEACSARSLALDPHNWAAWMSRAARLGDAGRCAEALDCTERALAIEPKQASIWFNKGILLAHLGRNQEALEAFQRGLELNPDDSGLWLNKAVTLRDLGRDEEAAECLMRAAELDPRNDSLWNNVGNALLRQERYGEALHCFQRGLEINPGDPELWNGKGGALLYLERRQEALEALDRGLQQAPGHANLRENREVALGLLRRGGRPGQVERQQFSGGREQPAPAPLSKAQRAELDSCVGKGAELYHAGHYQEALAWFERCVQIAPDNINMWSNKGAALQMLGRHDEALACYDRGYAADPGDRRLLDSKIALLAAMGGREQELASCCDAVLRLAPGDINVCVQKGAALYALGRYEQALQAFGRCLELTPDNAAMYANQGTTLLALRRYPEALAAYERGIALDASLAALWQGKGAALEALGRKPEAAEAYQCAGRLRA